MSENRDPAIPWQMVFAILGLVGGITTTWVTLKEEVVSLKKDITFLESKLADVKADDARLEASTRDRLNQLTNRLELIEADIQQMRIVRGRQ
jgi:BMFP domain-containing protein YqiC